MCTASAYGGSITTEGDKWYIGARGHLDAGLIAEESADFYVASDHYDTADDQFGSAVRSYERCRNTAGVDESLRQRVGALRGRVRMDTRIDQMAEVNAARAGARVERLKARVDTVLGGRSLADVRQLTTVQLREFTKSMSVKAVDFMIATVQEYTTEMAHFEALVELSKEARVGLRSVQADLRETESRLAMPPPALSAA